MKAGKRLIQYVLAYKGRLFLAAVCGLLAAQCNVFTAALAAWFTSLANNEPVNDNPLVRFVVQRGWFGVDQSQMALMVMISVLMV